MNKIQYLFLSFFTSLMMSSQWIGLESQLPARFEAKSLSSDIETTELEFRLQGYRLTPIDTPWGEQFKIETEGGSSIMKSGAPDLDQVFASVIIPDNSLMNLEVISSSYIEIEDIEIAPSKGNFSRMINPADVPFEKGASYLEDTFYPGKLADLRDPYILRDFRGQTVVSYPFQYNPVSKVLRIYTDMTVRISEEGQGQKNVLQRSSSIDKLDSEFKAIYNHQFANFEDDNNETRFEYLVDQGNMLVICYDDFMDEMQPFVDWKNKKGIPTEMVGVSSVGSNSGSIESYVSNYYYENGLTFLLLVGDINQIPSPSISGSASDPSYGFISGNDSYAEVIVGRFSGNNPSEILTQVERSLTYEQNPTQVNHFNNALGVASTQGPGYGGFTDAEFNDFLWETMLSDYTYDDYQGIYDSGGSLSQGVDAVNSGVGVINYTGHAGPTGWGNGAPLSVSDVENLNNEGMLPFIWTVGCNPGEFNNYGTCFTEAWLRSTNSNGDPIGAVGHLGSTISQSWEPPMHGQWAMNSILTESYDVSYTRTYGGISVNGCMHMNDAQGSSGINETNHWTLFGDPTLLIRSDVPGLLSINHDSAIVLGQESFIVDVGVDGALAALSRDGELLGSAYSDGGIAIIPLGSASNNPGNVDLVVTYYNSNTYEEELMIMTPDGAFVTVNSIDIDYGLDNTITAGETIDITVEIENLGNESSSYIEVTLYEMIDNPYISVVDGSGSVNSLLDGSVSFIDLSFNVSSTAPYGHSFALQLDMESEENSSSSTLTMTIEALTESFEAGNFNNLNWGLSGNADWSIDSENYYEGSYSARSGTIGDNTISTLELTMDIVEDGEISFFKKGLVCL